MRDGFDAKYFFTSSVVNARRRDARASSRASHSAAPAVTLRRMDETPDQRRARLAALRARATADGENIPASEPAVTFRNYVPRDAALASAKGEVATAPAIAPASSAATRDAVTLALEPNVGDVDPASFGARRANWDLKRDVEGRLEKLERRTRRALAEIAREEEARRVRCDDAS